MKCPRACLVVAACLILLTVASEPVRAGSSRCLLIHVDAVSLAAFERATAVGALPHLERIFADATRLRALTLYPACTAVIYPRLHSGATNAEPGRVGFYAFDRNRGRPVSDAAVVLHILGAMPRRARTGYLHGVPGFEWWGILAMQNLPDLLERYRVVEVFWFGTDVYGHLRGEEAHTRSLARLDTALGAVWPRLDVDSLNVILYSDHGLTFTDQTHDLRAVIDDRAPGRLLHVGYPNLYLRDPSEAPRLAHVLTRPGGFDYAFYRAGDGRVEGYVDGALVVFESDGGAFRYLSDDDPLGYAVLGYAGEALSPQAWLDLTIDAHFPATPPNVLRYLQHPDVGDLVAGVNPPRIPVTQRANRGNHAGLIDTDLVVPVLLRGPDVGALDGHDPLWLHELYGHLPELEFGILPQREPHTFDVWRRLDDGAFGAELKLSPGYRWRVAAEVTRDQSRAWGEREVFGSYLSRTWLGAGLEVRGGRLSPFGRGEWALDLAEAQFVASADYGSRGLSIAFGAVLRLGDHLRVGWRAPSAMVLGAAW